MASRSPGRSQVGSTWADAGQVANPFPGPQEYRQHHEPRNHAVRTIAITPPRVFRQQRLVVIYSLSQQLFDSEDGRRSDLRLHGAFDPLRTYTVRLCTASALFTPTRVTGRLEGPFPTLKRHWHSTRRFLSRYRARSAGSAMAGKFRLSGADCSNQSLAKRTLDQFMSGVTCLSAATAFFLSTFFNTGNE